jgi:hypothetical protein
MNQGLEHGAVEQMSELQKAINAIIDRNLQMRDLLHRMLDPEDLGWSVDECTRKEIKRMLQRHAGR